MGSCPLVDEAVEHQVPENMRWSAAHQKYWPAMLSFQEAKTLGRDDGVQLS